MNPYQVIKTIHQTEKSVDQIDDDKYTFIVHPEANKQQIKNAVKELFERDVKSVNVINCRGKKRRTRAGIGKRADWKKAVITLKEGQDPLDLF